MTLEKAIREYKLCTEIMLHEMGGRINDRLYAMPEFWFQKKVILESCDKSVKKIIEQANLIESMECCGTCNHYVSGMITSCKKITYEQNEQITSTFRIDDKCCYWEMRI